MRDKLDSYFISVGTTRVKLHNAVIFQQKHRNIICHDDLVYFVESDMHIRKLQWGDFITLLHTVLIILKRKCQLCVTRKFIHHVQWERLKPHLHKGVDRGVLGCPWPPLLQAFLNQTTYNRWQKCHDNILAIQLKIPFFKNVFFYIKNTAWRSTWQSGECPHFDTVWAPLWKTLATPVGEKLWKEGEKEWLRFCSKEVFQTVSSSVIF